MLCLCACNNLLAMPCTLGQRCAALLAAMAASLFAVRSATAREQCCMLGAGS